MALEAAGFLATATAIWLDELVDLPHHLLGAPASPARLQEAIIEPGLVLLLGVVIVLFTVGLWRRHLEGPVVFCAWCHRVRVGTAWLSAEQFLRIHRAETDHSVCADCTAELVRWPVV